MKKVSQKSQTKNPPKTIKYPTYGPKLISSYLIIFQIVPKKAKPKNVGIITVL